MTKKYAFIDYGGQVLSIETRCSCIYCKDKQDGELSIEDVVHPSLVGRYQEIPSGISVKEGMLFSDGTFKENPHCPQYQNHTVGKQNCPQPKTPFWPS